VGWVRGPEECGPVPTLETILVITSSPGVIRSWASHHTGLLSPRLSTVLLSDHQTLRPRSRVALNLLNFSIDWSLFLVLSCILPELRRFEDCSGNGPWPQWFSFRLENLGAALLTWAAVWCELWTMWTWDLSASTACYFLICCSRVIELPPPCDTWLCDPSPWIHWEWEESIKWKPVTLGLATAQNR